MRKSKSKTKAKTWPKIPAEPKAEPEKPTIKVSVKYKTVIGLINNEPGKEILVDDGKAFTPYPKQIVPRDSIVKLDPESEQTKHWAAIGAIEEA